eukprot:m.108957 g.108957  ORF g.108957 m.108957 type:complete len:67 (-) comp13987_c0_seq1:503-703(-)
MSINFEVLEGVEEGDVGFVDGNEEEGGSVNTSDLFTVLELAGDVLGIEGVSVDEGNELNELKPPTR